MQFYIYYLNFGKNLSKKRIFNVIFPFFNRFFAISLFILHKCIFFTFHSFTSLYIFFMFFLQQIIQIHIILVRNHNFQIYQLTKAMQQPYIQSSATDIFMIFSTSMWLLSANHNLQYCATSDAV